MKKLLSTMMLMPLMALAGEVVVTSVTAQQRYPWNGLVDITVTIQGAAEDVASVECVFSVTNSAAKVAIPVEHITRNGDDTRSGNVWTRKFIWEAKDDVGEVKIDDVALTVVLRLLGCVQLWENGPYWAECNIGASRPEECGYYFQWGDTVGCKRNTDNNGWISVKDLTSCSFSDCPTDDKDNSQLQSMGYIDSSGNLVAGHDAATVCLGAPWRMPTDAEFSALINNCTTTWTMRNGVNGRLVTGKGAYSSKSIFFPAAGVGVGSYYLLDLDSYGYYWSSTPHSGTYDFVFAWDLCFSSSDFYRNRIYRSYRKSVRPVRGFASSGVTAATGGATTHFVWDPLMLTGVTAQQRHPWNGLVDVTVIIKGAAKDVAVKGTNVFLWQRTAQRGRRFPLGILHKMEMTWAREMFGRGNLSGMQRPMSAL